jgi:phenylpropionate dioxygenase-like ring-hydroxylating dioxygenase large terminal subunit
MSEDLVDLVTESNMKYHGHIAPYKLRFPKGTQFFEDLVVEEKYQRISKRNYIEPAHLEAELRYVWKRVWQFACTEQELPEPGDFVTYDLADQGYLIVRQADGNLRAFHNACQHRGNRLAQGCGSSKNIRCPFHGWTWKLDGTLQVIPDRHTFDCLSGDLSLREVQCDSWAGLVFIDPDCTNKIGLQEFLGPVVQQLAPYRLQDMNLLKNIIQPLSSNWKTVVDAFVEIYHVNGVHPQFLAASDDFDSAMEVLSERFGHSRAIIPFGVPSPRLASYTEHDVVREFVHSGGVLRGTEIDQGGIAFDWDTERGKTVPPGEVKERYKNAREYLIARMEKLVEEREIDVTGLTRAQYVDDWHYFVFPGLVFNITAGGFLLLSMRPHATDPDRMIIQTMIFQKFSDAQRKAMAIAKREYSEEGTRSYGQILDQDYSNVVLTQRGMHSDGFEASRLSRQEVRIAMMRKVLDRLIDEGQRSAVPG